MHRNQKDGPCERGPGGQVQVIVVGVEVAVVVEDEDSRLYHSRQRMRIRDAQFLQWNGREVYR
jgi:hypothetical protein